MPELQAINPQNAPYQFKDSLVSGDQKGNNNGLVDSDIEAEHSLKSCLRSGYPASINKEKCISLYQYISYFQFQLNFQTTMMLAILEKLDNLANLADSSKAEYLSHLAQEITEAGLNKDQLTEVYTRAVKTAETIKDTDIKAIVLSNIALEMHKSGLDKSEVQRTFKKSLEHAQKEGNPGRIMGLIAVNMSKADIDKAEVYKIFKSALDAIKGIEDSQSKLFDLMDILVLISESKLDKMQLRGLSKIAVEIASSSRKDPFSRTLALLRIASSMATAGLNKSEVFKLFDKAINSALENKDPYGQSILLSQIAFEMAGFNKHRAFELYHKALEAVERIKSSESKGNVLAFYIVKEEVFKRGIVYTKLNKDQFNELFKKIMKIGETINNDKSWNISILHLVAENGANVGCYKVASEAAQKIKDTFWKSESIAYIALKMAQSGSNKSIVNNLFKKALEVPEKAENPEEKAGSFRVVALRMAQAGLVNEASEVFTKGLKAIEIMPADSKPNMLDYFCSSIADAGFNKSQLINLFKFALKIAKTIGKVNAAPDPMKRISSEMIRAGMDADEIRQIFVEASVEIPK